MPTVSHIALWPGLGEPGTGEGGRGNCDTGLQRKCHKSSTTKILNPGPTAYDKKSKFA